VCPGCLAVTTASGPRLAWQRTVGAVEVVSRSARACPGGPAAPADHGGDRKHLRSGQECASRALRHMRNQNRGASRHRIRDQAHPDGASVRSAAKGGHVTFVIKLCPKMRAALVPSDAVWMRPFRADTGACAVITTRPIAFDTVGAGEDSAATGRFADKFLTGQPPSASLRRLAYILLHRV
jgi:hypothetical protein